MNITTQQQLILEQQQRLYDTIERTGEHLDNKAAVILQSGGLILALTGATVLPTVIAAHSSPLMLAGVAVGFLVFIAMIGCAIQAWRPQDHVLPGGGADWDSFFDDYINREGDEAFYTTLKNLLDATNSNRAANERKSWYVTLSSGLLALQVAAILLLSIWAAVAG